MLSSKGTEDAIGKGSGGSSWLFPALLKPQLLLLSNVRAALAAKHECPKWTWIWECRESCKLLFSMSENRIMMWNMVLEPCERDVGYLEGNFDWILNGCLFAYSGLSTWTGKYEDTFSQIWNSFLLGKQNLRETSIDETQPCFKKYCWAFTRTG